MTSYEQQITDRVALLRGQLDDPAVGQAPEDAVRAARTTAAVIDREVSRLVTRARGQLPLWPWNTLPDRAWPRLHDWEESNEKVLPLPVVEDDVERHLEREPDRRVQAALRKKLDKASRLPEPERRQPLLNVLDRLHERSEHRHVAARSWARGALVMSGAVIITASALLALAVPLLPGDDARWVTATVLALGMVGALVSGYRTLYLRRDPVPESYWFDPAPTLMVLRTAMGLLAGYTAALLVAVGVVNLAGSATVGVLPLAAAALVGGFAQERLARHLDRQGAKFFPAP
ncbi:hypothetical protein Cfla_0451 [Cellulomonas flavigena DSM 20109]|uniref:Uncharacterized protein n=1 Tax=Cellulomonas flavigena (strain ATCC 482 / DSM 20109 / BCRC 11376 / JCM 18109 / NBRC 3775 / NCIMB 8073 / NRS 134) TaxID=446466 RepID=D5UHU2_CELFN|nr:hypothetical protein [Cellulomonas flavigena]ADG73366.1 hypothetical protein Cfla_0451 [Cellulomonas flavigena DSM 20109]